MSPGDTARLLRGLGEFIAAHADDIANHIANTQPSPAGRREQRLAPEVYLPVAGDRVMVRGAVAHSPEPFVVAGRVVGVQTEAALWTIRVQRDVPSKDTYEFTYDSGHGVWRSPDPSVIGIVVTRLE